MEVSEALSHADKPNEGIGVLIKLGVQGQGKSNHHQKHPCIEAGDVACFLPKEVGLSKVIVTFKVG